MIDLHTHSRRSDGSDPPQHIPELAARAGLSAVALVDHDRLDGLPAAQEAADRVGITLVPGCEVSCTWPNGEMHVLCYLVRDEAGPLQDELRRLLSDRERRNREMLSVLAGHGIVITEDELWAEAAGTAGAATGDGTPPTPPSADGAGRPHVAAILVRRGIVASIQEAFDVWLATGRPAYVPRARVEAATIARLANGSGGVVVLAHPFSLGLDPAELEVTVRGLAEVGFDGLEAYYAAYSTDERAALVALARRTGLVATGGSDYHGTYKPGLAVGIGYGDLDVPDEALAALLARR